MIEKKRIYTLVTLCIATAVAITIARADQPEFPELMSNARYVELRSKNDSLMMCEDSVQRLVNEVRDEFSRNRDSVANPVDIDRFTSHILTLEEAIFEIRQQRGDIITEINDIEQEYILRHMYSDAHAEERANSDPADSTATSEPAREIIRSRWLYKNDLFTEALTAEDYAELLVAQAEDEALETQCKEYIDNYNTLLATVDKYRTTDSESIADSLFSVYLELKHNAEARSNDIDLRWNHVIDTKYYALGYVLEKANRFDALDTSSEAFSQMQQQCSELDGNYASDALMHYAIGRATLLDYEILTAQEFGLIEALDSLQQRRSGLSNVEYRHQKVDLERRLFLDYAPIIIGRTNFYNSTNRLPELKVYERGTIYRILLGTFKSKQTMTLFKGVQPLFIDQNEKDKYSYYAGGFATLAEAEEAQLFLKEKGFKRPEICRWCDGVMVNLSEEKSEKGEANEPVASNNRYIVTLECDSISDDMRQLISTTTPDKMISRRGQQFAIGTFAERSEADLLMSSLAEHYPDLEVAIVQLDLQ